MGNKNLYKMVRIGGTRIKMFDGRIRTITAVKHVFDLQMNLIS